MYTHTILVRVSYADTDQMGVVHHSRYVNYYETARTEALRKIGVRYKDVEKSGIVMPVVSMKINYRKPASYDELLTVKTIIRELPSAKARFEYECYNESGILINTAETILVFIDKSTQKTCLAPEFILKALRSFYTDKPQV